MDRPRTGTGQHEAGAITVVDLIRRHNGPVRIPSADEVDTASFVGELLGADGDPGEPEPKRGWAAKAAKLVGLAAGSLVLCGSVVTASALGHRAPTAPTLPAPAPNITGAGVLRPDTLLAQLAGAGRPPGPIDAGHTSPPAAPPAGTDDDIGRHPAAVTPPGGRGTPAPPRTEGLPGAVDPVQLVRDFYALAASQPALAADLVDPTLLADPLGFTRSWRSVRQIRVDSVQGGSTGAVRAVIELLQADGTWVQVVELLHVTPGSTPVINGAQLLSAQRG